MSTTLAVLHVLMSGRGEDLLMTSSTTTTTSSLMTSRSVLASLDPVLVDFWSAFPCPPPWNEGLLFKVNLSRVGRAVGERILWFMADRCNISYNGTLPLPPDTGGGSGEGGGGSSGTGGGGDGDGGGGLGDYEESGEVCDMACKILVGIFCFFFVVGVIVGGVCILHRRRSQKRKDPRAAQQPSTGSGGDRGRALYPGIHYASASVITREGERPLPPCPEGEDGSPHTLPRQLHSYVYNPRDQTDPHPHPHLHQHPGHHHHHHPQHTFHLHLCPLSRRAAYRALDPQQGGDPSSSSQASNNGDELPHTYDYISDTESLRYHPGSGVHDYTYCTCEHSEGGSSSVAAECNSTTTTPRQSEGYYSDHDLASKHQHEISKPYPRYPDKPLTAGGGGGDKPLLVGGGGLNNNENEASAMLRFRGGVDVVDKGGRKQVTYPGLARETALVPAVGGRNHPQHHHPVAAHPSRQGSMPAHPAPGRPQFQRRDHPGHQPVGPPARHGGVFVDPPMPPLSTFPRHHVRPHLSIDNHPIMHPAGYPADRTHIPLQTLNSYEVPVDGIQPSYPTYSRTHIPLQSMNSYEIPVDPLQQQHTSHSLPRGVSGSSAGGDVAGIGPAKDSAGAEPLRFVNAPHADWGCTGAGDLSSAVGSVPPCDHQHHDQFQQQQPQGAADNSVNVLTVHPQYFITDNPEANASSV